MQTFFFTFETNEKVISFQNANYVYFYTQFKINLIFRIQTTFTYKFNSKISFTYIYQHDNDGPPYNTLVIDQISFWLYLGFKRNKHKCNFHYVAMPMMTSHILKSVDFTKTQKSRHLENETLFFLPIKKFIDYTSTATLLQKIVL